MPKVLYDVSLIGSACTNPHGRAGIFRVVLEILEGLLRTNQPPLVCALSSSRDRHKAANFFRDETSIHLHAEGSTAFSRPLLDAIVRRKRTFLIRQITRLIIDPLVAILERQTLRKLLLDADVYHTPMYPVPQIVRDMGIPSVITLYDLTPLLMPEWHQQETTRYFREKLLPSIREEDHVVCISEATRKDLLRLRPDLSGSRVSVVHLAASREKFHPPQNPGETIEARKLVGVPDGARYVLTLNTLEPRKNLEAAIQAFRQVCLTSRIDDVYLVLAGAKGWLKEELLKEVPEALRSRILMPGFIADEHLPGLYAGCDAFLYLSHYEGFGLPPLEAMCCGAAVICSNSSSLPEVVGDAAILVPPNDIESISSALLQVLEDRALQQDLSKRSLARAEVFSWDSTVRAYADVYQAVHKERCESSCSSRAPIA
jgi:glycosyltransferase involved in cell wall biosynthesis